MSFAVVTSFRSRLRAPRRAPALLLLLGVSLPLAACGDLAELAGLGPDVVDTPDLAGPPLPPDPDGPDALGDAPPPPPETPEGAALQFTGLEPAVGPPAGGVDILVRGIGFRDGLYVLFGAAVAEDVFVIDTRTAIVRLPPHPPGRVDVTVGHPELDFGEPVILPFAFDYEATRTVDAVSPEELPTAGGVPFTLTGTGFDPSTRPLIAGRLAIAPEVIDDRTITAISPPGPFGWAAVQLASRDGLSTHPRRVFLYEPPRLDTVAPTPAAIPPTADLHGRGLVADAQVEVGGRVAQVVGATPDGRCLTLEVPPGLPPAEHVVTVQTRWGTATLMPGLRTDEAAPACAGPRPGTGSAEGGDRVFLPCPVSPGADATVLVGDRVATIVQQDAAGLVVENPGGPPGQTTLRLLGAGPGGADIAFPFSLVAPAGALRVLSVTPSSGPPEGGTRVRVEGAGFEPGVAVVVGALGALRTERVSATALDVTIPPGSPGPVDVKVVLGGRVATLRDGYRYTTDTLDLLGVAPDFVAQSGGTRVTLSGTGFAGDARVEVGGVPCPVIARPSASTLVIRSPRLEPGPHDVRVRNPATGAEVLREGALVAFDPRSGFGGTWGDPIDGTLNVTVYGSNGHGPIDGAHVIVGADPATPYQGYTDDRGQVSLSEPGLAGPLTVTASAEGFSAASVVNFDATNVTITLQLNPIPPPPSEGEGGGDPPPPAFVNATLSGRVIGLDKYVLAPPGTCDSLVTEEVPDCAPCDGTGDGPDDATGEACGDDPAVACVSAGAIDGPRCLRACAQDNDCRPGYRCGATPEGARCIPSPGRRSAQCNVTSTSVFGYNYPLQPGSIPDADGRYTLDSRRLGELAVYCFGGYLQDSGAFIPTVLGVRRRIFATSGATMDDLDVELRYPLKRTFRVRLADPPAWSTPLQPPNIAFSLNLGADGGIGFSRDPQPAVGGEPDTWLLPRQLAGLTGDLYDASYIFYSTLTPVGAVAGQPRSFNLVQAVRRIVEDRLPVRDEDGRWRLEGTQLERSLHGLWRGADDRLVAVGEAGTILVRVGERWTPQTSPTAMDLRAVHGLAGDDIAAVGDRGTVVHWDGLRWSTLDAPPDDYTAVLLTPGHLLVAGALRMRALSRETGAWTVAGGPGVTGLRGFVDLGDGTALVVGDGGQVWRWTDAEMEVAAQTDGSDWLAGATLVGDGGGEIIVVGHGGAIGRLEPEGVGGGYVFTALRPARATSPDLTAVAATQDGGFVAVGDHGAVVAGAPGGAIREETIEDYRSRAEGVAVMSDGTTRVVGSAAFILGPFLAFPRATAPAGDTLGPDLTLGWTWDGGPDNQYTRLALTPEYQLTAWVLVVDGHVQTVALPDLVAAADIDVLPPARYRFEMLRVLNRGFDIDNYTNRGFNLYLRDSWSTNQTFFRIE